MLRLIRNLKVGRVVTEDFSRTLIGIQGSTQLDYQALSKSPYSRCYHFRTAMPRHAKRCVPGISEISNVLLKQKNSNPILTRTHSSTDSDSGDAKETVTITYIDREGERHVIEGKVGDNVMYLAQRHDLDVEGACEASLACCTCHVYVKEKYYDMLEEPTEEEEDMLDLAPFLQENSRLCCQIILSKDLDGIEVQIPSATRNFYVDGHKPKHH